ncbi:MAG: hypothetical protein K8M05_28600 [Deltaproteobacteria bacterium]|nr:hypothetical protein [Kofleriaceae bacterium]
MIGAASQAAGCIIVSDDDDTGDALVTWDLLSADQNGNAIPAGCPAGATSAIIYALPDGAPAGDAYIDKYNCADGGGTAADLPEGRYLVWVRLTDTSEATLYAESGSLVTDIVQGASTPVDHSIFVDHAFYQLSWTLNPTGGGSVNCSQVVGEDGVSIVATAQGGSFIDTIVDCEEGLAPASTITDPLPSSLSGAQYTIAVSLLNAQQQSIGDAPTVAASPDIALNYGNEFEDLGTLAIEVR